MPVILRSNYGGSVGAAVLVSIAITTPPTKTTYRYGQSFNPAGMVVTATYSNNSTSIVTGYTFDTTPLSATGAVIVSYTEGDVTKSAAQSVTVTQYPVSIAVTTPPTKRMYASGSAFNTTGMVVTATMSNGTTKTVTGYSRSPSVLTMSAYTVTITYTENSATVSTTQVVNVYTYSGTSSYHDDGSGNWRIKFTTSGTFTVKPALNIQAFLVGGGGGGGQRGAGGGGGYTKTANAALTSGTGYTVTIGAGGPYYVWDDNTGTKSGGTTSAFGQSASGGGGGQGRWMYGTGVRAGNGGSGGGGYGESNAAGGAGGTDGGNGGAGSFYAGTGQGTTTKEFGIGTLYSGGGGGGGQNTGNVGGSGGGGRGGNANQSGTAGTVNTGGGGGGGGQGSPDLGGTGGSGIVVIRNPR